MAIQSDPSIRLSKVPESGMYPSPSSGPADEQPALLLVAEEKLRLIKNETTRSLQDEYDICWISPLLVALINFGYMQSFNYDEEYN